MKKRRPHAAAGGGRRRNDCPTSARTDHGQPHGDAAGRSRAAALWTLDQARCMRRRVGAEQMAHAPMHSKEINRPALVVAGKLVKLVATHWRIAAAEC